MTQPLVFSLCADDYAMTPGVSAGIIEALDAGALSATSVMTTSPWWPDAAGPLKAHEARADIGLHLNLTLGAPLTRMPKLAPQGRFPDVRALLRHDRNRTLPLDEVAAEIDRQCQLFVDVFGRRPDHVDGHQHVHALRSIRPLVFDVLTRRGWRPWLRDSSDRLWRVPWRHGRKKAAVLTLLTDGFARDARKSGLATNCGFSGFSSFDPSQRYERQFETYLRMPGPRHLVMCHPGYVDNALRQIDPVVDTREDELRYLTSAILPFLSRRRASIERLSTNLNDIRLA